MKQKSVIKRQKINSLESSCIDAYTVLKMATINGAKALGLENEIVLLGAKDNPYPFFKHADFLATANAIPK